MPFINPLFKSAFKSCPSGFESTLNSAILSLLGITLALRPQTGPRRTNKDESKFPCVLQDFVPFMVLLSSLSLKFTIMHSRATDTADLVVSLEIGFPGLIADLVVSLEDWFSWANLMPTVVHNGERLFISPPPLGFYFFPGHLKICKVFYHKENEFELK